MYSNCYDSYRPVIIGFVQYQHSPVQPALKKLDRNHFSFGNYRLSKSAFLHCFHFVVGIFCQPAYKINRKTQTFWTHCSKTSKDRRAMWKRIVLEIRCFFRYQCQFFSLRQKNFHFRVCLQTVDSAILKPSRLPKFYTEEICDWLRPGFGDSHRSSSTEQIQ